MKNKTQFTVSMAVPGLPFSGSTLETQALGGSETAAIYMAKALAREGCDVSVFCTAPNNEYGTDEVGVRYLPLDMWAKYIRCTPTDVSIIQRMPKWFSQRAASKLNLLWCHDLALGRSTQEFRSVMWNVDKVLVLSEYMRQQYKTVHGLDDDTLYVTRNGIDLPLIQSLSASKRNRKKLVYSARPERGLDILLGKVMPKLLEQDPEFRLYVAGYDNPADHLYDFYQKCNALAAQLGDRVVPMGSLSKRQLYEHYLTAGVYVYPTPSQTQKGFAEVSCISAMEAQACGLPIVTSDKGALSETVSKTAGYLFSGDPWSDEYVDNFVTAVRAASGPLWEPMHNAALERAKELDWQPVAADWVRMFEAELFNRSMNKDTVVRHFWRTSDIVAADRMVAKMPESEERQRLQALLEPFQFMKTPDGMREQYEKIGSGHDTWVIDTTPHEPRFKVLLEWLQTNTGIRNVLDYGCAHGSYATRLAEAIPDLYVTGIDIDKHSTAMARGFADKLKVADRCLFLTTTHDQLETHPEERFDAALLQEVLEHVYEPWDVIERVEATVAPGGKVYITVPYGPWEYSSYFTYPHRCHIWHFDQHDIRDMIGHKPDLQIDALYGGDSDELGDPMGWWVVSYTADHTPVKQVDVDRKTWLVKPRQTVSASLIAGPDSEDTLRWCLRSLKHVADEIVIADCGMSKAALEIAAEQEAIVVPGVDPKKEGFERARNCSLSRCTMDWVLWIDTDEKLVSPTEVTKYLRENAFHGYGIRQHHFAVDVSLKPDMPVRLFRNRPYKGRKLEFFGAIHEHPEMAVNDGPGPVVVISDVNIAHVGYLNEKVRKARFVRNFPLLKLDQERYPNRLLQKHFVMRDNIHMIRFALEQNGGVVDEFIKAKARETVAMYREHFLGKPVYMNTDSLGYYSEALKILGEGFEVAYQVVADAVEARPNGATVFRFASPDDFEAELMRVTRDQVSKFASEHY